MCSLSSEVKYLVPRNSIDGGREYRYFTITSVARRVIHSHNRYKKGIRIQQFTVKSFQAHRKIACAQSFLKTFQAHINKFMFKILLRKKHPYLRQKRSDKRETLNTMSFSVSFPFPVDNVSVDHEAHIEDTGEEQKESHGKEGDDVEDEELFSQLSSSGRQCVCTP